MSFASTWENFPDGKLAARRGEVVLRERLDHRVLTSYAPFF